MRTAFQEDNIAEVRDLTFHGMNALHHGQAAQAEELLTQAAQACPENQRIRQHLATAMVRQGKTDQAMEQLQTAIQNSHDPRIYVELGNLHLSKKQTRSAMQCADAALAINRQSPCAWILRGRCQESTGDFESALASFHRAAALPDANAEVQIRIAETYRAMQKPMQALNALEIYADNFGLEQVPIDAVQLTAATLVDLNQSQRAGEVLAAATERPDATPETWLALSRIQSRQGDHSTALMTARNAQSVYPQDRLLNSWTRSLIERTEQVNQSSRTAGLPTTGSSGGSINY